MPPPIVAQLRLPIPLLRSPPTNPVKSTQTDVRKSPMRGPRATAFVTPTLSVIESTTGVPSGASLVKDLRLEPFINRQERTSLNGMFPKRASSKQDLRVALAATKLLHEAKVPILAGTDAPNPGTSHGSSLHREVERWCAQAFDRRQRS